MSPEIAEMRQKIELRRKEMEKKMAGNSRSGRPASVKPTPQKRDGKPQSPRELSISARRHFDWLIERLAAGDDSSPWRRIDGACLASLAELLESEERLAELLHDDPANERYMRLRLQHSDRVFRFSAIVGLTPRDRERLPQNSDTELDDVDFWEAE